MTDLTRIAREQTAAGEAYRMVDEAGERKGDQVTRNGDWMLTATGRQFWPLDPRPEEIDIEDIAHSLAHQCRFAGHCRFFYSVAQHSVLVSKVVPPEHAAWGLLHDAAEAYLVDLPRPIKRYSEMGDLYREIEGRLMRVICERFGLSAKEPLSVKFADDVLLMTEKRDVMPPSPEPWRETAEPMEQIIRPWTPNRAKIEFLRRVAEMRLLCCGTSHVLAPAPLAHRSRSREV